MMRLPVVILLLLIGFSLFGQNSTFKNKEFSFSVGVAEFDIEKIQPGENLDFINYFNTYPEYLDYIIAKFGYKFDFLTKMSADIKIILMDDLIPDNYDISTHYFFKPWAGLGVGSLLNKNYITYFEQYQIQMLPDYYLMSGTGQFTTYDLGFYLSPALKPIDNDFFKLLIKCDLGISSLMKEKAAFFHKRKLSNERLYYNYKTETAFQPYIHPKLELRLRAFKIKNTSIGILLNSGYFDSGRSINYVRTIQRWTSENSTKKEIQMPKHNYSRFEFDMGIFVKL